MAIIHICDRCGAETKYPHVGANASDPLGQRGMQSNKSLCDGCEEERARITQELDQYRRACLEAWYRREPEPRAPYLSW